jgi:hypothetical protein
LDLQARINLIVVREEIEAIFAIIGSLEGISRRVLKKSGLIRSSGISEKGGGLYRTLLKFGNLGK